MSDAIISVENLGKKYRIKHEAQHQRYTALRDVIAEKAKSLFSRRLTPGLRPPTSEDFWALRDVSFEVKQGEVVGIVGRNGAGKSTLLKILSRITEPTEGRVRLRGRVASLLEVGTGFHPELTGRENIFLNGAILGMHRAEIKQKFDEIVAFAEVERFLDTPVKRYSSGMYVRLAFAVAAHLEPEILIVDEVLAVGDTQFQKKCLGKMQDVSTKEGRTVLFVSHNMGAVETLCGRGLVMHKGSLSFTGRTTDAIRSYLSAMNREPRRNLALETDRKGSGVIRLHALNLSVEGERVLEVFSGADLDFEFIYSNPQNIATAQLRFTIYNEAGVAVTHISNSLMGHQLSLTPGSGVIICKLPRLALNQGHYRVAVAVQDDNSENYDHIPSALCFDVVGSRFFATSQLPDPRYSVVLTDHAWI